MPITAERMIDVISLACHAVEVTRQNRKTLRQARDDLEIAINGLKGENDFSNDYLVMVKSSIDRCIVNEIDEEAITNLMYEKAKFEINSKKNSAAKWRMEMIRNKQIKPKKQDNPRPKRSTGRMTEREMLEDMEEVLKREKELAQEAELSDPNAPPENSKFTADSDGKITYTTPDPFADGGDGDWLEEKK